MRFSRFGILLVAAALLIFQAACKKSNSESAGQTAPAGEPSTTEAQASIPAAEQSAPAAEAPSVRIVETAPAAAPAPAALPELSAAPAAGGIRGTAEVHAALKRKDYVGAVMALQAAKVGIKIEQRPEYNGLLFEVKQAIVEEMAKNPSAKRAWDTLRLMEAGR